MFGFKRRGVSALGVRFCDGCGDVTTAAQRAAARREQELARTAGSRWGR